MRLLLARHGNTFGPQDTPVWVGGRDDLPLVEKGRQQAQDIALLLAAREITPVRIVAGPLQRTLEAAEIIAGHLKAERALQMDERLREIDYGQWAGKTTEEIIAETGPGPVEDWQHYSRWPADAGWQPHEDEVVSGILDLAWDLASEGHGEEDTVLCISSNGVLRYFLQLIEGEFERRIDLGEMKMATGALGQLSFDGEVFEVDFWNLRPEALDPTLFAEAEGAEVSAEEAPGFTVEHTADEAIIRIDSITGASGDDT